MISLFHRLPLGGKLLAKQGDEGQPNNIQAFFSSKSRFILSPHSWLPLRGSCRLLPTEEVFAILPLAYIKFCSQNFLRQKLSGTSCLPLGGNLLAKQGDEGQPNNNQAFFSKSRFILNPHSRLPPTEEDFASLPLSLRQAFPLGGRWTKRSLDE